MPRPRFEKLPPEKQASMLEIAAQELALHGFEGASLNHILEAAGVSKGAAYYYFDDKADLFATVFARYWSHVMAHAGLDLERVDARSFWPRVIEVFRQALAHFDEQPWMLGLAKALWNLPQEARANRSLAEVHEGAHRWLLAMLRRGQELGAIRTDLPDDLLLSMVMALDDAFDRWLAKNLQPQGAAACEEAALKVLDAIRQMLQPPRRSR